MRRPIRRNVPGLYLLAAAFALVATLGAACRGRAQEALPPAPPASTDYLPAATVKDLMDTIVDPSADVVWDAVATVQGPGGTEERTPRSEADWTNVRLGAIRLVEASNLLMMPGRHIARSDEKSETPGVELEPGQMEDLVKKDLDAWITHARALREISMQVLHAVDRRDAAQLFEVGDRLDGACESCHVRYWYPNEKVPPFPPRFRSVGQ